jgi:limonene-1,2-epoxide hydrolase
MCDVVGSDDYSGHMSPTEIVNAFTAAIEPKDVDRTVVSERRGIFQIDDNDKISLGRDSFDVGGFTRRLSTQTST